MKVLRWVTGFALAAALVAFLATPWLAVRTLRAAAARQDEEALAAQVDFDSLRDSVKLDLLRRLAGDGHDRPTHARELGAAVAGALLGPMVDELVTPHNLALLLQGHRVVTSAGAASAPPPPEVIASGRYESFDRFVYALKRGADDAPVEFVFERDGLTGWKLAELRFH
ncbi:MAG: DUF2939 domain-containing protein [Pelomonas sp.]|nr:DUF2939 domain-containing protein [Roseateles sp.]